MTIGVPWHGPLMVHVLRWGMATGWWLCGRRCEGGNERDLWCRMVIIRCKTCMMFMEEQAN